MPATSLKLNRQESTIKAIAPLSDKYIGCEADLCAFGLWLMDYLAPLRIEVSVCSSSSREHSAILHYFFNLFP